MDGSAIVNHDHLKLYMVNGQIRNCQSWSFTNCTWSMDRSATVNHDHLKLYMVNFNPID